MSKYWTPSGAYVSASTGVNLVVSASGQIEGLIRVLNIGGSLTFAAICTANASAGEALFVPVAANADFFIAFGAPLKYVMVTNSTCMLQAGYAQK